MTRITILALAATLLSSSTFAQLHEAPQRATSGGGRVSDSVTGTAEGSALEELANHAFLTGKVDNPKRIAEITKLGVSHWTTGDKASYVYTVVSYMDEQPITQQHLLSAAQR